MVDIWYVIVELYPITYFALIPFTVLLRPLRDSISNNQFITDVNQVFVKDYGYILFTIIYSCHLLICSQHGWTIPKGRILRYLRSYGLNTVFYILVNAWCFGPSVFERINVSTGGHCDIQAVNLQYECESNNGIWIDGFDSSGHLYLLISVSLLTWKELLGQLTSPLSFHLNAIHRRIIDLEVNDTAISNLRPNENPLFWNNWSMKMLRLATIVASLILLLIWYSIFIITCLFFHTLFEKFVGLFFGLLIPLSVSYFDVAY